MATGGLSGQVLMGLTRAGLAAVLGLLAGPWLRGMIFAHTVAWQRALRVRCPGCGIAVVVPGRWGLAVAAPLDGRCPGCRTTIGPPAGSVEIMAATVLAALTVHASADRPWVLAAWIWLAMLGIALAIIDADVHRLPDPLTDAATGGVLLLLGADAVATGDVTGFSRALACSAGLGTVYLIAILTSVGMGRGDGHLALSLGLVCGQVGVQTVWVATLASVGLAGGYVMIGRLAGTLRPQSEVALGPLMLAGALLAIVVS